MDQDFKLLALMPYEPPWQYYVKYRRFLGELKHPFLRKVDFLVDETLSVGNNTLKHYKAVVFFYHDPLEALYPKIYRYAKRVEQECFRMGITMINRPDPLSWSVKSIQLDILAKNGFSVAKIYKLRDIDDLLSNPEVQYPIFLRYDAGHDSLGQNYRGPFFSLDELRKSDLDKSIWNRTEHLDGVVALRWIDTRGKDGLYRKYRVFVFGNSVLNGPMFVSSDWFVHGHNQMRNKSADRENERFMQSSLSDSEKSIFCEINKVLQLDFSAIDYSYDQEGNLVIWEANPHPSLGDWAEKARFKKEFTDALSVQYGRFLI